MSEPVEQSGRVTTEAGASSSRVGIQAAASHSPPAGSGVPALSVASLVKSYPTLTAVRDLSFSVKPGQVLAMVGPNGAGKTTTMRCIAGILPATRGVISIGGADLAASPVDAKKRVAYVPDDPKLFDNLTVWEHLEFIAAAYELRAWELLANQWLERFELAPKRDTPTSELSRGMRQKIAVIAAYVREPAFIMLDEPMTGLDPRGIRTMKDSIREQARAGAGVMLSSHLLALVEDLCDALLIMHKGQRMFFGSVSEARAQFASQGDASLEEVFFRATEGNIAAQGDNSGAAPVA
jgi:ABC-2 type transport system ATP-binding protein